MAEQLKIIIDADVNSAVNGMKALQGGIVKLNKSTTDFVSTLRTSFDPAVFKSFKQGTLNVNQMKLALETLKENMRLTSDPAKLVQYNLAIKDIEGNLKRASIAGTEVGSVTGKAFSNLTQSALSLARILPGIGIAGLIGGSISAITELGAAFLSTSNKAGIFKNATENAIGKSAAEIFEINAAVSVIKDFNSSLNAQKNAREFLNKETGIGIDLLSKEKIGSEETSRAIKKHTDSIFQRALAEAFAAKSAQKQVELFEKQQKLSKILASIPTTPLGIVLGANTLGSATVAAGALEKQIEAIKNDIIAIEKFGVDAFSKAFDFTKAEKSSKTFKDLTDSIISRARQFAKEFGDAFVVPNLEESFFTTKQEIFNRSKQLLYDVAKNKLKVRIPVAIEFEPLPETFELSQSQIDNFFSAGKKTFEIPIGFKLDPTLLQGNIDKIDQKLNLRKKFEIFGDLGFDQFKKIDFTDINKGLAEGNKLFESMMQSATLLQATLSQGLTSAFDSVFDSILEGKNVFQALGDALKQLVIETIKAVAKMLILKAITNLIFPGGGGAAGGAIAGLLGGIGGSANGGGFGLGGQIGSRSFGNVLNVVVTGQVSGQNILLAGQRAAGSNRRTG